MRDFANSTYQRRKVAPNKVKIQRKPLDLKKYLKPLARITGGLAGLALIGLLLYGASIAIDSVTFFSLKNIDISSTKRLTRSEILALTGIEPGKDLLRMNLKRMGDQLLQNPWIESVQINRYLPDGISIAITEREPLAIVNMGFIYYLDHKGKVFKALNQGDKLDYPVITGFSEEQLTSDPNGSREALLASCELLRILKEKGAFILADVSEIHYDKGYGFTMFTSSGALPVKIGSGDFSAKIERFAKVYEDLTAQGNTLQYVDLDYNDKIIVKKS